MRKDELKCWENVQEDIPIFRNYKNISNEGQERPDFIFEYQDEIIGIEHFLVDLVETRVKKSKYPQSRRNAKEELQLLNKWQPSLCEAGFAEMVLPDTEQCINDEIQRYSLFDYQNFISEFKRIFGSHIEKTESYMKTNKMGFLIEIPVPLFTWMVQDRNWNWHKQSINGIPMTEDIWNIINRFDELDFVIIHAVQNHNVSNNHNSILYDQDHHPNHLFRRFRFLDWLMSGNASVKLNLAERE